MYKLLYLMKKNCRHITIILFHHSLSNFWPGLSKKIYLFSCCRKLQTKQI